MANVPTRPQADEFWRTLLAIADDAAPGLRRAWLSALRALGRDLPLAEIERALLAKDSARVLELIPWDAYRAALEKLPAHLLAAAESSHTATNEQLAALARAGSIHVGGTQHDRPARIDTIATGIIREQDRVAITARAADRVREVTDETRRAIKDIVQRAYDRGLHPRAAAKELQQVVGLTRRGASAVESYRHSLADGGTKPNRVERMVQRYAEKLRKLRALTIAETEAAQAVNDGQQAAWAEQVRVGVLDRSQYEQEWAAITEGGGAAKTCPRCLALDGTRAPLGGQFVGDTKGPIAGTPLHPRCRCVVVLVQRTVAPERQTA